MGYSYNKNQWLDQKDMARLKDLVKLFHKLYMEKTSFPELKHKAKQNAKLNK